MPGPVPAAIVTAVNQIPQYATPTDPVTAGISATPNPSLSKSSRTTSNNAGAIVGGVLGGLAIIILAVFAALMLRTRARRRHMKTASAQFIQRHPPEPASNSESTPEVRRASIHKQRPPPARYMPSLSPTSEARSMRSFDPPSTINVPREGRSPIRDNADFAFTGYGAIQDNLYGPRRSRLTVENLREHSRFVITYEKSRRADFTATPTPITAEDAKSGQNPPILL